MYETLAAILVLIVGILNIFFSKKMLNLSKSSASKHKDYINQYIANYPEKSGIVLVRVIGVFFVIVSAMKLFL
jgi:hypothetical protein